MNNVHHPDFDPKIIQIFIWNAIHVLFCDKYTHILKNLVHYLIRFLQND
jgi:hypothetical protein